ncbi:MAG: tRNA (adenosine(37)-N6)-dimethylallyltransferase MiaA [Firmicutes bacterium]|jgi:tRNA dimethylallyltransferase|nr:tRNA (adenosine(37)-N6)-dimethylallyltransferase MiaA [Bacillota bacterium]MDH7495098.1 tRNA (adenosine(37)-N6)-dimethylallyltransferase MiaA [Bacillota bacterium]
MTHTSPDVLVVIVGPTAVGKTDVSMEVAARLPGEIVSCDSMQVYRHMDIGTAKPSPAERSLVPHHLIDVVDPDEAFNVAIFQELARAAIRDIASRGLVPVLVGGTGLYVRAAVDDFLFPWGGTSPELRRELKAEAKVHGAPALHQRLVEVDPVAAHRIHPNDARRIIRALEVHAVTGRPISEMWRKGGAGRMRVDRLVMVGLVREREALYERIDRRCDAMIRDGLVDETRALLDRGYERALTAGQALGYKEIVDHLRGMCSLSDAVEAMKRNTRRYAKRQLTWFRADPRVEWVDLGSFSSVREAATCVLALVKGKLAAM